MALTKVSRGLLTTSIVDNGNATAITIDSSENVGIGVSPEAWNTYTPLQVQLASLSGYTNGDSRLSNNAYYAGGWKYINSIPATQYLMDAANGVHTWSTAASGTADAAITWQERMRISAEGYVTTPYQPAFDAHHAGGSYASGTTASSLDLNTTRLNRGGHYNTSTDRFVAPVAGVYQFNYRTIINGAYTSGHVRMMKNAVTLPGADTHFSPTVASGWSQVLTQITVELAVDDYVQVYHLGNTSIYGDSYQSFNGYLIG